MSSLVIPLYKLFDKLNLLISGYLFMDLLSIKNTNLYFGNDSFLKKIAVLLPIIWYIYLMVTKFLNRKILKQQQELETKNLELSQEIKESILKRIDSGNIEELIEEIEHKEFNRIKNNEKN